MICNGYMPRKQLSMTKYRTCHWISLLFHPRQSDFEGLLLRTSLISGCHRCWNKEMTSQQCFNNIVWGTEMFMILDSHKVCETSSKPWPTTYILPLQSEVIDMEGWTIEFFIIITLILCIMNGSLLQGYASHTMLTKMFS